MNTKTAHQSPAANPAAGGTLSEAFRVVHEGLRSMQALQMQTAETHKRFLEAQSQANRTIQEMMESTRHLAEASLRGVPAEFPRTAAPALPIRPPMTAPTAMNSIPAATVSPPPSAPPRPLPVPAIPAPAPAPGGIEGEAAEAALLSVVSELTGYPSEMISMEMDIEVDLGIDSIKRVEILSAFEERMPHLPQVSPEVMGSMKTLGQIVRQLVGERPATAAGRVLPATPPAEPPAAGAPPVESVSGDTASVSSALLSVVSELTGYPSEMISMEMDIEADLGIDSIKRVEILSAFEERMPHLPQVSPEMMGSLKTLGQIVGALTGGAGTVPAGTAAPVAAAAALSAATAPSADMPPLEDVLLSVVSELTGYPAEMISMEMDIEADLGIDSIKRVEILSAFEERMPHLPSISPEMMGSLKTLGQIAAHLRGGGARNAPAPGRGLPEANASVPECFPPAEPADAAAREAGDDRGTALVERKIVVPVFAPAEPGLPIPVPRGRPVFVTEDGAGLGKAMAAAMEARGLMTVVAPPGDLLEWKEAYPAGGLVILADAWGTRDARFLGEAFSLARGLAPDLAASGAMGGALFATVSRLDGAFGFRGRGVAEPFDGGLAGLAKTAAVEWPGVVCRALDIAPDWDDPAGIAEAAVAELLQSGPVEVGLDREDRWTLSLEPAACPEGEPGLKPGDLVVATGGARGVTAACLSALAGKVPLTLVLMGRSPLPGPEPEWLASLTEPAEMKRAILAHQWPDSRPTPAELEAAYRGYRNGREIAENLRRLAAAGATVRYESVDVRDPAAVGRVLDAARAEYGPVKALIHGAGVLEDRLIVDKTPEQFARVFDTKVGGLEVLLDALKEDPLSCLVLFSSVAARMGNRGQADYAMANEVLNKIAQRTALARPACRVLSLNWGPWDGGMVSPELRREFARSGVSLIPVEAGTKSMVAEMAGPPGAPVEIVLGGGLGPAVPAARAAEAAAPEAGGAEEPADGPEDAPAPVETPAPNALDLLFKREVDIERFPVVGSSLMDGRPVFPFALMTEWLGHGALHGNPGLYLHGLDDVRMVRRIQVGEEGKLIRLMAGKARRNGTVYEVDVELRNGVKENEEVVHSRARAILTESPHQEPPAFSPPPDIRVKSYARSTDEIYETILPLGEELRGIREIMSCSPRGIIARITSAPPPDRWMAEPLRSRWIGDPLVLDSAFQMVTVWAHEQKGMRSLPNYGAAYRQYRAGFPENGVTAVFEVTGVNDDTVTGNFTFLDAGNAVVAQLLGYEAKMVKPAGGQS